MSTLPRITVITPSFNQAQYLERTIRTVTEQHYENLEYFVIDGGSTDGSVDIIKDYAHCIDWWVSEDDNGQTHAINKGIARASGDIIAYLNSDDIYFRDTLNIVGETFAANDGLRWLVGGCEQINEQDCVTGRFPHQAPQDKINYLMRREGMIPQPSSFWSSDLFATYGTFPLDMHYTFDFEFNCRLLFGGEQPMIIDRALAGFRLHGQSKGCSQGIKFGFDRIEVMRRYLKHLGLADRLRVRRNMGYLSRAYAIQHARMNDGPTLWSQVARHPWWLASGEIRQALSRDSDHSLAA